MHSRSLWTALSPVAISSEPSFGVDCPVTRYRGWELLEALNAKHENLLSQIIHIISPTIMQVAWQEQDTNVQTKLLDTLLTLLSKHQHIWTLAGQTGGDDSNDEGSDEENPEEGEKTENETNSKVQCQNHAARSSCLTGFQRWIQSGCAGNADCLKTILVFLTTIPAELFPASESEAGVFLDNFWAALSSGLYDSDTLGRNLFLSSFIECSAYIIGKIGKSSREEAAALAGEYLGRIFTSELLAPSSRKYAQGMTRLNPIAANRIQELRKAVDEKMVLTMRNLSALKAAGPLLATFRRQLEKVATGETAFDDAEIQRTVHMLKKAQQNEVEEAKTLLEAVSRSSAASLEASDDRASLRSRTLLLSLLVSYNTQAQGPSARTFAHSTLPVYIASGNISADAVEIFARSYFHAASAEEAKAFIIRLIEAAGSIVEPKLRVKTLQCLLNGVGDKLLAHSTDISGTKLDDVALEITNELISGSYANLDGSSLLARLLESSGSFIKADTVNKILALMITHLHSTARRTWLTHGSVDASREPTALLQKLVANWVTVSPKRHQQLNQINLLDAALIAGVIFRFAPAHARSEDKVLYERLRSSSRAALVAIDAFKEAVLDSKCHIADVLDAAGRYAVSGDAPGDFSLLAILPSRESMQQDLSTVAATARLPSSHSIMDGLIPQNHADWSNKGNRRIEYDVDSFAPFSRMAFALLATLEVDRQTAKTHPWAINVLTLLALACEDELQSPGSGEDFFDPCLGSGDVAQERLRSILTRAVTLISSILASHASSLPEDWHATAIDALQKGSAGETDPMVAIIAVLWQEAAAQPSSHYLPRLFSRVLAGILSFTSASEQDATKWLRLAAATETKAPRVSEALILAVKPMVYDSPFYDRLRNDIVARLTDTPPSKANSEGLRLLSLTLAVAPPVESHLSLVPQQRALFLLQGLQRWMASEEDLDDEINTRLAELFLHIVPIVQEISGSHIDFFYDLIESNLEVASLTDKSSLAGLYHTLRLFEQLVDLATSNPVLRKAHREREAGLLDLLRPLLSALANSDLEPQHESQPDASFDQASIPLPFELTADLLMAAFKKSSSTTLKTESYTTTLCRLLNSSMREVQLSSYRMLSGSIRASVQQLIFESALVKNDESEDAKEAARKSIRLPAQLIEAVRLPIKATVEDLEADSHLCRSVFSYLLAWLAILEHFEEATVQLKSMYAGEIQREGLLASSLLPTIFRLVDPRRVRKTATPSTGNVVPEPFDPDRYAIDEIFLDFVEATDVFALQQLATHVYFRALLYVPTLVREWWLSIRDRQFSLGVASFTTRHCSPLIASRELSHLREPEALSRLQDEAMTIRVLGSNEAVATYTVDEHPMEIGIKVPHDYPLHGVEVRDIRHVGVSEAQWRAWLLAVQQLIVGQNGLVVDALMLFKRNAEAKFAGFEGQECAICYSIISPEDRSLPTKPCRTCKNKFHAACLYRWLYTSGSATCPLCRSIL